MMILCVGAWAGAAARDGEPAAAENPANAAYVIEGEAIRMVDGKAEHHVAPGSAERVETRILGEPVWGDLNGDGREDAVMVLSHRTGGTGSFYYVAAAIQSANGWIGTNAVLLGDRIPSMALAIRHGVVIASYADRRATDPMAAAPSVETRKFLRFRGGTLIEDASVSTEGMSEMAPKAP
jgi:hypothetical protein